MTPSDICNGDGRVAYKESRSNVQPEGLQDIYEAGVGCMGDRQWRFRRNSGWPLRARCGRRLPRAELKPFGRRPRRS